MKMVDTMPMIIVIAAILANIAIGVRNGIGFSALMVRCMIVTVIFGIFGYMITDTINKAIECSNLSKLANVDAEAAAGTEENRSDGDKNSGFDIKVPPLDDEEFMSMDNGSDDGFIEVNPAYMGNYDKDEQD